MRMTAASLELVCSPVDAALTKAYTEFSQDMGARGISARRLHADAVTQLQQAQSARTRAESEDWRFPFHELTRERLWRRLPATCADRQRASAKRSS